jgi:hypothetical protein
LAYCTYCYILVNARDPGVPQIYGCGRHIFRLFICQEESIYLIDIIDESIGTYGLANWYAGVQVCHFSLNAMTQNYLTGIPPVLPSLHFQTLFCQGGRFLVQRTRNRILIIEEQELLILSASTSLHAVNVSGNLKGILVAVDAQVAW